MSTPQNTTPTARRALRTTLLLVAAIVVAVAVNAAVAWIATALGAPAGYGPLSVPAQALFTIVGVVVGWVGWRMVTSRARDPRRILRILVPAVVLVSLVPDALLLVAPVIPGTNLQAVLALMTMHLVVAACGVAAYTASDRELARRRPAVA